MFAGLCGEKFDTVKTVIEIDLSKTGKRHGPANVNADLFLLFAFISVLLPSFVAAYRFQKHCRFCQRPHINVK